MTFLNKIKSIFSFQKAKSFEQSSVSNTYQIKYVDLKNYGFIEAGKCVGSAINYSQYLDDIAYKRLIDISLQGKSDENEKRNIQNKIDIEKRKIVDSENDIRNLKQKNEDDAKDITRLESNIQKYTTGEIPLPFEGGRFDIVRFIFLSVLLILSTIALYLFYCGVIFKGAVLDVNTLAKGIKQGIYSSNILPNIYELVIFFTENTPYIVLPIIFFVFGYTLDQFFHEAKSTQKNMKITGLLLITVVLDLVFAYMVQQNIAKALILNKQRDIILTFYLDGRFYLALFFGFISFIFWSVMMYYWNMERSKRDIFTRIEEVINNLRKNINKRRDEIREKENQVQKLNQEISILEIERDSPFIDKNDVKSAITNFSVGWFNYLANILNQKEKINECTQIKNSKLASI